MTHNKNSGTIFQAGILLGRITQYCVDRRVVRPAPDMGLADYLSLLSEEICTLPLKESVAEKIRSEISAISINIAAYPPDKMLEADDARIMIGLAARWTEMILTELGYEGVVTGSTDPLRHTEETNVHEPAPHANDNVPRKTTTGKDPEPEDSGGPPQKKTVKKSLRMGSKKC